MIDMTDEEKSFMKSCDEFKEYGSIDEYVNDIRRLLMIGIMPPRFSLKDANKLISRELEHIKSDFEQKIDACACAANIAYCCG